MWYVNALVTRIKKSDVLCFILTMWYVNSVTLSCLASIQLRFILTMWYVNYFPNDSSLVKSNRNKIIRKEFDGDYKVISRKFRISEVKVRNIINLKDL